MRHALLGLAAAASVAACGGRFGGEGVDEHVAVALRAGPEVAPATVAERLRRTGAGFVLLTAPRDSAWFGDVATGSGLRLSGPARDGELGLAFLGPEALGDTTIAVPVGEAAIIVLHDALYRLDEHTYVDLMIFRAPPTLELGRLTRAVLEYVATDVLGDAAILLAVETSDPAFADSLAVLLRPNFASAERCLRAGLAEGRDDSGPADGGAPEGVGPTSLHLFYGPDAEIRCREARRLTGEPEGVLARLRLRR